MGLFSSARDRLVERVALPYLNHTLLAPYGRATRLEINSTARTLQVEVALKGETAPIQIEVFDYDLSKDGERYFAMVKRVQTSREWLTILANDQLRNGRFEVPAA